MESEIPDHVHSGDSFSAALQSVVESAYENGVAVEGAWFIETDADGPDWDIEIWAVEADRADE